MSSPDDQNLGEDDDLKKAVVEDDLQYDYEKTAEESGSSSSALNASEDKGDEDDGALIAESDEADKEKENPISNVEEITEGGGSSSLNISEDIGEKKTIDSEDRQDDDALIAKSDEAVEEKEIPISTVQEITEEEGGSSSLDISEEKGKKKISDSADQQDDDLSISKSDEADEEERNPSKLRAIGTKIATAGCFVDGGDSVLLAHDDGSCSLYDAANFQEKLEFESDTQTRNLFRDCWVVKTHGPNQESTKYAVATSSGNRQHSGFCSWDFESGQIQTGYDVSRSDMEKFFGVPLSPISAWWHSPNDHLVAVAFATLKRLTVYDVRDFEEYLTKWDLPEPVCPLQHTNPLQWRDKGKIVIAHPGEVAFWDINRPTDHAHVLSCGFGRDEKVCALHVTNLNPDAEAGGIRQRASASPEAPEGVVCTSRSVLVLDSRKKDGTGIRVARMDNLRPHSVFCDSSSFYMGCDYLASSANISYVQHYSLRSARMVCSYAVRSTRQPPDDDVRSVAVRQAWGGSRYVMGMSRSGLHVFDPSDDMSGGARSAREVLGCGDEAVVRHPSFDVEGSRVLLVNGHGPAQWKILD